MNSIPCLQPTEVSIEHGTDVRKEVEYTKQRQESWVAGTLTL